MFEVDIHLDLLSFIIDGKELKIIREPDNSPNAYDVHLVPVTNKRKRKPPFKTYFKLVDHVLLTAGMKCAFCKGILYIKSKSMRIDNQINAVVHCPKCGTDSQGILTDDFMDRYVEYKYLGWHLWRTLHGGKNVDIYGNPRNHDQS